MSRLVHISEAASIAIHSLALIASTERKLNVKTIASILHVSSNHLAKVLQTLARYGYLDSNRGPGGGFMLKKPANQISMLEVYELIEGSVECKFCEIEEGKCPFVSCVFGGKPDQLTEDFTTYLRNTFISQLKTKDNNYA